mmetsp:Transcript_57568/g.134886  ORF Transcript_57568/g.134886 Transcript_57568/m.134886 type:complete len:214 (+) Transcript_57568:503-1144(+)
MATRPCFNSIVRYLRKVASSPLQRFAGSQNPRGAVTPTCADMSNPAGAGASSSFTELAAAVSWDAASVSDEDVAASSLLGDAAEEAASLDSSVLASSFLSGLDASEGSAALAPRAARAAPAAVAVPTKHISAEPQEPVSSRPPNWGETRILCEACSKARDSHDSEGAEKEEGAKTAPGRRHMPAPATTRPAAEPRALRTITPKKLCKSTLHQL